MSELTLPVLPVLLIVSVLGAFAVLWLLGRLTPPDRPAATPPAPTVRADTFLFHDAELVDHDIADLPGPLGTVDALSNWADLRRWLSPRFVGLPADLATLTPGSEHRYDALPGTGSSQLVLLRSNRATRAVLSDDGAPGPAAWHGALGQAQSAGQAQNVLDHAPFPIWKTDANGTVIWRNAPCAGIAQALGAMPDTDGDSRFAVPLPDADHPRWYEVTSHRMGDATLHFATNIGEVIRAESARRDFVQTLTKTFANLTTGLAVFDRNRQLVLFNPALVDLTGLAVPFLSARPDVIRFFDELRERQVLPEPKNYSDLRARIREVITLASDDSYQETWSLPAGVTYRVTGRPHPNGAVAFLIEDISADILKTRQYRTQIDLGQSVIDGLEKVILVLDSNDRVMLSNTACSTLLGIDPDSSFADMSVQDLISVCRDKFRPDSGRANFETTLQDATETSGNDHDRWMTTLTGQHFRFRIKILPGGMRLVSFLTIPEPVHMPQIAAAQ